MSQQARPMFDSMAHDGVKRPGTREMTALLAGLMALNAFAIDAMVPALPAIGRSLHLAHENPGGVRHTQSARRKRRRGFHG